MSAYAHMTTTQHATLNCLDSRFNRLISVIDKVIESSDFGLCEELSNELHDLKKATLDLTHVENFHMKTIRFPAYIGHKLDHYKICSAIAGICVKSSRGSCTMEDLQTFREMLYYHITAYDYQFEHFLITGEVTYDYWGT